MNFHNVTKKIEKHWTLKFTCSISEEKAKQHDFINYSFPEQRGERLTQYIKQVSASAFSISCRMHIPWLLLQCVYVSALHDIITWDVPKKTIEAAFLVWNGVLVVHKLWCRWTIRAPSISGTECHFLSWSMISSPCWLWFMIVSNPKSECSGKPRTRSGWGQAG